MSIELQNISKTFGKTTALDQVSLTLEPGHIYGLLGSNGAGKTTHRPAAAGPGTGAGGRHARAEQR